MGTDQPGQLGRFAASFPAVPGQLAEARRVLGEHLRGMGVESQGVTDVQLAVNEAIGNAVVHAYRDSPEPGAFDLEAHQNERGLEVVVRDQGCGQPTESSEGAGLGLPLIRSLADDVSVEHRPGEGTEVVMRFHLPS